MADTKIYNLTEETAPTLSDVMPMVDISADETKKLPFSTMLDTFVAGASQRGTVKMTVAPASASNPLAVGDNDPRMTAIGNLVPYAVDAAGTDTYVINPSPAISAYSVGQQFNFKVGTANTGAATLNVNGLGAKSIVKDVSTALATGDLLANQIVTVEYDGTNMQLLTRTSNMPVVRTYLNGGSPATWTKPSGLKYITVEVQAGGGGGGSATAGGAGANKGGGGGGGGYSRKTIAAATLGATETVTTGAGGTAGTGGGSGGTGGTSSFGSHASATGGAGGVLNSVGGAGGIGSSGDINTGGSAGQSAGSATNASAGAGGASALGGGAQAAASLAGVVGQVYGGGGSGGQTTSGGAATDGGAGAAGIVIVTEYY